MSKNAKAKLWDDTVTTEASVPQCHRRLTFSLVTAGLRGPAQPQTLIICIFVTNQSSGQTKIYNCH